MAQYKSMWKDIAIDNDGYLCLRQYQDGPIGKKLCYDLESVKEFLKNDYLCDK